MKKKVSQNIHDAKLNYVAKLITLVSFLTLDNMS